MAAKSAPLLQPEGEGTWCDRWAAPGCGSAGVSPWDGETGMFQPHPLSSGPTARTNHKKRPMASGRCQSAGNALVRSWCVSARAGTRRYRGI